MLVGGDGRDTLKGGSGNDVLLAFQIGSDDYDVEIDVLIGWAGRDLFGVGVPSYWYRDDGAPSAKLMDFKHGVDLIGLFGRPNPYDPEALVYDGLVFADVAGGTMVSAAGTDIVFVRGSQAAEFDRSDFVLDPAIIYGTIETLYYEDFL